MAAKQDGQSVAPAPDMIAAARQLGIRSEDAKMMKLVEDMLKSESLPEHWTAVWEPHNDRWVYTYTKTGEAQLEHPLIEYYRGAVFMDKGGYRQLLRIMEQRKPTYEQVMTECQYFGIQEDEDIYIQEVAELKLCCPLPPGWEQFAGQFGERKYRCAALSIVLDEHPLDPYFRELRDRRRKELQRRRWAAIKAMQAVVNLHQRTRFEQRASLASIQDTDPDAQHSSHHSSQHSSVPDTAVTEKEIIEEPAGEEFEKQQGEAVLVEAEQFDDHHEGSSAQQIQAPQQVFDPCMEELMQEWVLIHQSAQKLAGSVLGMAESVLPKQRARDGSVKRLATFGPGSLSASDSATAAGANMPHIRAAGAGVATNQASAIGSRISAPTAHDHGVLVPLTDSSEIRAATTAAGSFQRPHPRQMPRNELPVIISESCAIDGELAEEELVGSLAFDDVHNSTTATPARAKCQLPASLVAKDIAVTSSNGHSNLVETSVSALDGSIATTAPTSMQELLAQSNKPYTANKRASAFLSTAAMKTMEEVWNNMQLKDSRRIWDTIDLAVPVSPTGTYSRPVSMAGRPEPPAAAAVVPTQLLKPDKFKAAAGGYASPTFEPSESDDEANIMARAKASLQALRSTLENAAAMTAGLPVNTPAVLATLPKGWLELVKRFPPNWHNILLELPHDWSDLIDSLPPNWAQVHKALPQDWKERIAYDEWPGLIQSLDKDWVRTMQALPPGFADIIQQLPQDWAERMRVSDWPQLLGSQVEHQVDSEQGFNQGTTGKLNGADRVTNGEVLQTEGHRGLDEMHGQQEGVLTLNADDHPDTTTVTGRSGYTNSHDDKVDDSQLNVARGHDLSNKAENNYSRSTAGGNDVKISEMRNDNGVGNQSCTTATSNKASHETRHGHGEMHTQNSMRHPATTTTVAGLEQQATHHRPLPSNWVELLATLPDNWLEIVSRLPADWAQALNRMPKDWPQGVGLLTQEAAVSANSTSDTPQEWTQAVNNLPPGWLSAIQQLPGGWPETLKRLPPGFLDQLKQLPTSALQAILTLPPEFLETIQRCPENWAQQLHMIQWPELTATLPNEWPQLLRSLPPKWPAIAPQLPTNWHDIMRVEEWPTLLSQLPSDWVERLQSSIHSNQLQGHASRHVHTVARSTQTDSQVVQPTLSQEVEAFLSSLPPGWEKVVSQLPPDWATKLMFNSWLTLVNNLPPDWLLQLGQLKKLPHNWQAAVANMPNGWADTVSKLPADWHGKLHFKDWHKLVHVLPAGWPSMLRTLPSDWLQMSKDLPPNWVDVLLEALRNCGQHHSPTPPRSRLNSVQGPTTESQLPLPTLPSINNMTRTDNPYVRPSRNRSNASVSRARALPSRDEQGGFDTRPVPPEIKARANSLLDKDLKRGRQNAWDEAPDERVAPNYVQSEIANLKQRLVRAEMLRAEMAAAHAAEKKTLAQQLKAEKLAVEALERKCETQTADMTRCRAELSNAVHRNPAMHRRDNDLVLELERLTAEVAYLRGLLPPANTVPSSVSNENEAQAAEIRVLKAELQHLREQLLRVSCVTSGNPKLSMPYNTVVRTTAQPSLNAKRTPAQSQSLLSPQVQLQPPSSAQQLKRLNGGTLTRESTPLTSHGTRPSHNNRMQALHIDMHELTADQDLQESGAIGSPTSIASPLAAERSAQLVAEFSLASIHSTAYSTVGAASSPSLQEQLLSALQGYPLKTSPRPPKTGRSGILASRS